MPELPEVEVVRRGLAEHVAGRSFGRVELFGERVARRHPGGPSDLAARIAGRRVDAVRRRGKYLWLELSSPTRVDPALAQSSAGGADRSGPAELAGPAELNGSAELADSGLSPAHATSMASAPSAGVGQDVLLLHLGMSGQLLVTDRNAAPSRHLRASFDLVEDVVSADGGEVLIGAGQLRPARQLRFVDQRTFGGMSWSNLVPDGSGAVPDSIAHIARDLLDPDLDQDQVIHRLRSRRSGIKRALLDQTLVSGIGNIYADEALWRVGLHGERRCAALTKPAAQRLLEAARSVMTDSLAAGGTSFDALYVNINGQSGYFDRSLAAYGQDGRPCQRCGTPIRRAAFMNRSSYSCPRCQPRPRPRR